MKSNMYKENIAPVVVLVAICLVVTGLLAFVNSITAPIIEANASATIKEIHMPSASNIKGNNNTAATWIINVLTKEIKAELEQITNILNTEYR